VRLIVTILSFLPASGLELVGSFFSLIPSQGMHGNERFLLVLLYLLIALVLVNLVGAAIGLFPLGIVYGVDTWWRTVLGFVAGSIVFAISLSVEFELIPDIGASVIAPLRLINLLVGLVGLLSPPAGGLIALIAFRRRQRAAPQPIG
jgi:hypothetical protein